MKRIYLLVVLACSLAFANAADSNWALWVWSNSGGLQNINGGTSTDHDLIFQTTADPNIFEIIVNSGSGQNLTAGGEFCFRDIKGSKWYKSNSTSVSTKFNADTWTAGGYWTGSGDKNMSIGETFKCKRILLHFIDIQHYNIIFESEPKDDTNTFDLYTWTGGAFNGLASKNFQKVKDGIYCIEIPDGESFLAGSNGFLMSHNGILLKSAVASTNALNTWNNLQYVTGNNILLPATQKVYKFYIKYTPASSASAMYASTIPLEVTPADVSADQYTKDGKLTLNTKITAGIPAELAGFKSYVKSYSIIRDNVAIAPSVAPDADGNLSYIDVTTVLGQTYNYTVVCNYIDYAGSTDILKSAEVAASPVTVTLPTAANVVATSKVLYDESKGNNIFLGAEINWTPVVLDDLVPYNVAYKITVNDKSANTVFSVEDLTAAPYTVYGIPESDITVEAVYTPKLTGTVFTPVAEAAVSFVPPFIAAQVVDVTPAELQASTDPASGVFRAVMQWNAANLLPVAYYEGYRADITTNADPSEGDYVLVQENGSTEFTVPQFEDMIRGNSTLADNLQVKFAYKILPYYYIWNEPVNASLVADADYSDYSKSKLQTLALAAVDPTEILFDKDTPTSVESVLSSDKNIVYPSPTEGDLHITFNEPVRKVGFINLSSGAVCTSLVFDGTESSVDINVSDLPSGLYAIMVNDICIGKVTKK